MNKFILVILVFCSLLACFQHSTKKNSFEQLANEKLETQIDSLISILSVLKQQKNTDSLKLLFLESRSHYKIIEPFVEYYFQGISRRINGPALPEIKTDDNIVNDASGFQVIEEIIFNDFINRNELIEQIQILITDLKFVKNNFSQIPLQNHHFYELIQHQIIRIAALGITGFDSPIALFSINEAKFSLKGLNEWYGLFCKSNKLLPNDRLIDALKKSIGYTQQFNNFTQFNRLEFIKNYLMPLSLEWELFFKQNTSALSELKKQNVFSGNLADLMQGKKLNPDAFSPYAEAKSSPEKIKFGKLLFNETSLSRSNKMSCAACHKPDKAFTDEKTTSSINIHKTKINRNSPTLLYSSFQKAFFYDLRAQDLENQIEDVMKNPNEFNLTDRELTEKIRSKQFLIKQYYLAYKTKDSITTYHIRNAIAAYIRSLLPFTSKMDDYFNGRITLSQNEINGFNIFTGKAKCATCHFIPFFNGTIPPWFNNSESEVIGVPQSIAWKNAKIDQDPGRYTQNQLEPLRYAFKTPTVRNIEKTAPYMHNGVYKNLEDVIRFYELGGGKGIGIDLTYQTLPFDKLELTSQEKNNLLLFLKTLTDKHEDH